MLKEQGHPAEANRYYSVLKRKYGLKEAIGYGIGGTRFAVQTEPSALSSHVCDLYAISGMQPNIPIIREKYISDGLHPNDKGNEVIADRLGEFLKNL